MFFYVLFPCSDFHHNTPGLGVAYYVSGGKYNYNVT